MSCVEIAENKAAIGGSNYISAKVITLQNSTNDTTILNSGNGKIILKSK